jgi:hypothetical protein
MVDASVDGAISPDAGRSPNIVFGGAVMVGAAVAVALGVYGQAHDPASETTVKWFFTSTLHFKAWLTTAAVILAILQVLAGMWMYGKLGKSSAPDWVGPAHRMLGSLALLLTLPVAYHCLWSLGFNPDPGGSRRLWHSILGCLFYGAFATKVMAVRSRRMPGWALPVVGASLFTVLVLIWLTSSLWFFRTIGVEI